ncbi:MAG: PQQ-binding-like beta-propeller repeat protein [Planctomycetota bacterium]
MKYRWLTGLILSCSLLAGLSLVDRLGAQSSQSRAPRFLAAVLERDALVEKVRRFEAAASQKDWSTTVTLAQELIESEWTVPAATDPKDSESKALMRPGQEQQLYADEKEKGLHLSVRDYITRRLVNLPHEALKRYREIREDVAAQELIQALKTRSQTAALSRLVFRYGATAAGMEALRIRSEWRLERGDFQIAARGFEDWLDLAWTPPLYEKKRVSVLASLSLALSELGEIAALTGLSQRDDIGAEMDQSLKQQGKQLTLKAFCSEQIQRCERRRQQQRPAGPTGKLEERWRVERTPSKKDYLLPQPRAGADSLVFHDHAKVLKLQIESGDVQWEKALDKASIPGTKIPLSLRGHEIRSLAGAYGSGCYAFVTESRSPQQRTLVVLDAMNGETRWLRYPARDLADYGIPSLRYDPNPLIVGSRLFVTAIDGAANPASWICAFDLASAELLWMTRVPGGAPFIYETASPDQKDETVPRAWLGCLPMAVSRGLLYLCNNLGSLAALEVESGRLRFLYRYPRRRVESRGRFDPGTLSRGWRDNPVQIGAQGLAFAPDDADFCFFMYLRPPLDAERRSKNLNWLLAERLPRGDMTQLIAMQDGQAWLGGFDRVSNWNVVQALAPFRRPDGLQLWPAAAPLDSEILGRGIVDDKNVYVCSRSYVYAIGRETGVPAPPLLSREDQGARQLGDLELAKGRLVVVSKTAISCYGKKE